MPIFIKIQSVKGQNYDDHKSAAGGATGGVWKTTNFLTTDGASPGVRVSRISLTNGLGEVNDNDAMPARKMAMLFESAGRSAPSGKLYVATDTGVFAKSAARLNCANNLKQISLGVHSVPLVEIIVTDAGGANQRVFRLRGATITPAPPQSGDISGQSIAISYTGLE